MKSLVISWGLVLGSALFAPPTNAQKATPQPAAKAVTAPSKAAPPSPRVRSANANPHAARETPSAALHAAARTTAAGDTTLVAHAGAAAVLSPPDGFEYER